MEKGQKETGKTEIRKEWASHWFRQGVFMSSGLHNN
jgi:hypothetical protein